MKKHMNTIISIFGFVVIIGLMVWSTVNSDRRDINKYLPVDIPIFSKVVILNDTHSTFQKDGELYAVVNLSQSSAVSYYDKLESNKNWYTQDIPDELISIFNEDNEVGFDLDVLSETFCGEYYFVDRSSENNLSNFTFIWIDTSDYTLYIYVLDYNLFIIG